jgi:hypothetical protein
MKPFELKEALEQGYAYTRDKRKIVDLKLSDLNITYRLTGRIEDNPEIVRSWTVNGDCGLDNPINYAFDLCYLELETIITLITGNMKLDRLIDIDKLLEAINFNKDYLKNSALTIVIPQQK